MSNNNINENIENIRFDIVNDYIKQKIEQIHTKLGILIDFDEKTKNTNNYIVGYMKTLASERILTITKSLCFSFRIYMKNLYKDTDTEFCKKYHQLLFRELCYYLILIQLNECWSLEILNADLCYIFAGISTLLLNPPKGHEIAYLTINFLIISILSTEREICVFLNHKFEEEYAGEIFENFYGTYFDYFLLCLQKILNVPYSCKPFDNLIGFIIYNLYFFKN